MTFRLTRVWIIALLLFGGARAYAVDREHQLKAAFIFNFAKFIEWPGGLGDSGSPFVIGVYGTDTYGQELEQALGGKNIDGHPIIIEEIHADSSVHRCRLLITGANTEERISQLVRLSKTSGTVLIGDAPDFARMGGTVGFGISSGKIRFDVNLLTARADSVAISSRLLGLARSVIR